MAIFHLHAQIISRGEGRSAVAAAAYRHRARMEIEAEARFADYSNKSDLVHSEFSLPEETPAWLRTLIDGRDSASASAALWNAVEAFEKRPDAQFMREMDLALPVELSRDQNIMLVRAFVTEQILSRGMVADWVYHDVAGNPHVHVMTTLRPLTEEGFGSKKVAVLDETGRPRRQRSKLRPVGQIVYRLWAGDDKLLNDWRKAWAVLQNGHLAKHGFAIRVDHRSLEEQGVGLVPTTKIGVGAKHIARKAEGNARDAELERLRHFEDRRRDSARRIVHRPEILLDIIARERSVFDERDLAKLAHRYIDDPGTFANVMARLAASPDLVRLQAPSFDWETGAAIPERLALRTMIRTEAEMVGRAVRLAGDETFTVGEDALAAILHKHPHLHDGQRAAIEYITRAARIAVLVGLAGTGKTTALTAAREAWERAGYRVVGGALAGKAAEGLEKEAGIGSRTLAAWELRWRKNREPLDDRTVFVMDEAGMVGSRQMARVVEQVTRSGAKLVIVGDGEQLQPIEAGAAFRAIHDEIGYVTLESVRRQKQRWMRQASLDFARGKTQDAIESYRLRGKVRGSPTKAAAMKALVSDWSGEYNPAKTSLILAHLRRDVRMLNEQARSALIERGLIAEGCPFQTEQGARNFAAGDQIVFLRNEGSLGVKNGMLGRVVSATRGCVVVEVGDRRRRLEVSQAFYRDIDHGYATTIHKAQGATVDRVKVLASLSLDRHLSYVAMTRHRDDAALYFGHRAFERAGGLGFLLSRRNSKETTLDYVGSREYREAFRYAVTRGLYAFRVARALLDDQVRLIARAREEVSRFATRLGASTFGNVLRSGMSPAPSAHRPSAPEQAVAINGGDASGEPLLPGITHWIRSTSEAVNERVAAEPALMQQWREVSERFSRVYRDPEAAARAMNINAVLETPGDHRTVRERVATSPETFGELRGKIGLFASKAQKQERDLAIAGAAVLKAEIERYTTMRSRAFVRLEASEIDTRKRASIEVPALSPSALVILERVRVAIDGNDLSAALAIALSDRAAKSEIDRMNAMLAHRFGERRLLGSDARTLDGATFKALTDGMPASYTLKLAEVWPMLRAAQQLGVYERTSSAVRKAAAANLRPGSSLKPRM